MNVGSFFPLTPKLSQVSFVGHPGSISNCIDSDYDDNYDLTISSPFIDYDYDDNYDMTIISNCIDYD